MTDEYFYIEEISPNSSEIESEKSGEKKCLKTKGDNLTTSEKKSQEIRLHEIEQQLEMAESRCNTLKGQVDYMKMIYNGMNGNKPDKKDTKIPQPAVRRHLTIEGGKRKRSDENNTSTQNKGTKYQTEEAPSRDRDVDMLLSGMGRGDRADRAVCERDANAAVKSINNIISGITNSVNRLTQLQVNIGNSSSNSNISADAIGIQNVVCSPRYAEQNAQAEKPYQQDSNTKTKPSSESMKSKTNKKKKGLKGKSNSKQSMCSVDNKKRIKVTAKHIEKKTKLTSSTFTAGDVSQLAVSRHKRRPFGKLRTISSRTLLIKKSMNNYTSTKPNNNKSTTEKEWKSDKLIEIYHNSAVKITTGSDDSIPNKKATKIETKSRLNHLHSEQVISSDIKPSQHMSAGSAGHTQQQQYRPPLSPINEQEIHYAGSCYNHNYELPTIASKMKQVAKSYFENFSFRTIPFVAAKSITPSHNLGINIQQVLSIIKGKKPVAGISPTLAYNIELAANKLGSRPLSALVSNLGSRMNSNKTICPLARKYPFSHLQEMAKEIPEETIEEINAAYEEDSPKLAPAHTLAAGDDKNPEKVWYAENKKSEKCTCVPKQGVSFNDVYNTYSDEQTQQRTRGPHAKRIRHRPWNENRPPIKQFRNPVSENLNYPFSQSKCNQINKRERSLKEVLKNLHDEFALLNDRYEDLKTEVATGKSSDTLLSEIEKMEKDLQNKEDEITMVMSLYREVVGLKQQVKMLKTRASQSTIVVSPFINRRRDYKDLNAAGHLTKLLRHIQQFQETLKK